MPVKKKSQIRIKVSRNENKVIRALSSDYIKNLNQNVENNNGFGGQNQERKIKISSKLNNQLEELKKQIKKSTSNFYKLESY
jgi:hypothetical protein